MESLKCAGFDFFNNFDSANLARVEQVPLDELGKLCYVNDEDCLLVCVVSLQRGL